MDILVFTVFILWTLLSFIVINNAIWSTDHKVSALKSEDTEALVASG